jgi:uncharacterized tellurite resistance protein B-like protein
MKQQLTTYEKYAIISILSQIMKADGIIHPKEEEFMDKAFGELGITINDLGDIASIDEIQAKLIIDGMTSESRNYARTLFIGMAESDCYVDPRETALINKMITQ